MSHRYPVTSRMGRQRHFDQRNLNYTIADVLGFDDSETIEARNFATSLVRHDIGSRGELAVPASMSAIMTAGPTKEKYHWDDPSWDADQGDSPMCTGYSGEKLRLAGPTTGKDRDTAEGEAAKGDDNAQSLYYNAVRIDKERHSLYFDGGGATMLALAKAGRDMGFWKTFGWGYTLAEFVMAIVVAPVLLGIDMPEMMFEPDRKTGLVRFKGTVYGGHSIMAIGADLDDGYVTLANTWSRKWGKNGRCILPFEDLEIAIAQYGEILVVSE